MGRYDDEEDERRWAEYEMGKHDAARVISRRERGMDSSEIFDLLHISELPGLHGTSYDLGYHDVMFEHSMSNRDREDKE